MNTSIGCFVPSVVFSKSYGSKTVDRSDLRLDDLIKAAMDEDASPDKIQTAVAIAKGDSKAVCSKRSQKAQEYYERHKDVIPGYVMASILSQYHRQKLRNKPETYGAIKHEGFWYVPAEIAENPPTEKRGRKGKEGSCWS